MRWHWVWKDYLLPRDFLFYSCPFFWPFVAAGFPLAWPVINHGLDKSLRGGTCSSKEQFTAFSSHFLQASRFFLSYPKQ